MAKDHSPIGDGATHNPFQFTDLGESDLASRRAFEKCSIPVKNPRPVAVAFSKLCCGDGKLCMGTDDGSSTESCVGWHSDHVVVCFVVLDFSAKSQAAVGSSLFVFKRGLSLGRWHPENAGNECDRRQSFSNYGTRHVRDKHDSSGSFWLLFLSTIKVVFTAFGATPSSNYESGNVSS